MVFLSYVSPCTDTKSRHWNFHGSLTSIKVGGQSLTCNITFCTFLELLLHLGENPLIILKIFIN